MVFPNGEGSIIALVKFSCNKVNKGKIRPRVRDMYSKMNVGQRYPSGHHWMCVLAKENLQRLRKKN